MLESFLMDCSLRGRTKRTIETYKSNVGEFLRYYPEPHRINKHDLRDFLKYLQERGLKNSTLKSYFSALSSFYDFLIYEELAETNPILPFRQRFLDKPTKHDRRQLITIKDMQNLIGSIDHIRERTMLCVLAKHGVRHDEYFRLKPENIDLVRDTITYPDKAKRHNRTLPIDAELHELLDQYLKWRGPRVRAGCPWLWISDRGGRIHKDYTNAVISFYAQPLRLHQPNGPLEKRLTCHCFRKWFTHYLYAAGMGETMIKILRGDSLSREAWSSNYLEPNELTEEVREEYFARIPRLFF